MQHTLLQHGMSRLLQFTCIPTPPFLPLNVSAGNVREWKDPQGICKILQEKRLTVRSYELRNPRTYSKSVRFGNRCQCSTTYDKATNMPIAILDRCLNGQGSMPVSIKIEIQPCGRSPKIVATAQAFNHQDFADAKSVSAIATISSVNGPVPPNGIVTDINPQFRITGFSAFAYTRLELSGNLQHNKAIISAKVSIGICATVKINEFKTSQCNPWAEGTQSYLDVFQRPNPGINEFQERHACRKGCGSLVLDIDDIDFSPACRPK
jgi:hypothetical protein